MNYELAKELKDAGFNQDLPDPSSYFTIGRDGTPKIWGWSEGEDKPYGEYVKAPTLDELIDACGDMLDSLVNYHSGFWCAKHPKDTFNSPVGRSRVEAVAKLWLALNKK